MYCTRDATFVVAKPPDYKSKDNAYVCDEHLAVIARECVAGSLRKAVQVSLVPKGSIFNGPECEFGVE